MSVLVIHGPPVTKKNSSRILRGKGGKPFVMPSKAHENWYLSAHYQVCNQFIRWPSNPFFDANVNVKATFYRAKRTGDLINYCQALADLLEKAGVLLNDKQIVGWDGSRLAHDKANPRIEVTITKAE